MAFDLGWWTARWVVAGACTACGVSVTQPISAGPDAERAPVSLTDGLVAYWKLDESSSTDVVTDATGNGSSGMPVGGPAPSAVIPPVRFSDPSSRSFDGLTQYIEFGNPDVLNFTGEITLAAWVYLNAISDGCHYIVAHGYCWEPPGEVALRIGSDTCGPGGSPHNWVAGSWLMAEHGATSPLTDLDVKAWVHLAGVYDGQNWILYRNGVEVVRQASAVGAVPVQSNWAIGARSPGVGPCMPVPVERFWNGTIDDVRVYRRALRADEILELYHQ